MPPEKKMGLLRILPSNFLAPKTHWIFLNLRIHTPFMVVFNLMFALSVIETDSVIQNTTIKSFNQFYPSARTGTDMAIFFWQTEGWFKKPQKLLKRSSISFLGYFIQSFLCNVFTVLSKIELSFHFVWFNEMLYLE